jgi:hypothetical protein
MGTQHRRRNCTEGNDELVQKSTGKSGHKEGGHQEEGRRTSKITRVRTNEKETRETRGREWTGQKNWRVNRRRRGKETNDKNETKRRRRSKETRRVRKDE